MPTDNVRQHAVPRFYLRFFTDAKGRVHVYRKSCNCFFCASPDNISAERECFTVTDEGQRDVRADEVNQRAESAYAPVIRSLLTDSSMTNKEWTAICGFTANLLARSRVGRDALQEPLKETAQLLEKHRTLFKKSIQSMTGIGLRAVRLDAQLSELRACECWPCRRPRLPAKRCCNGEDRSRPAP